jgi:hypothetical protein
MDEIEVPTEHLHEAIHEKAEESAHEKGGSWNMYVAISTAMIAVLAAIAGLMAGHHSNEALIEQIRSSDQWAYYLAKGIKAEIKGLAVNDPTAVTAIAKYKKEQEEIKQKAEEYVQSSEFHLSRHVLLAKSVTLFQIAIAISAIAILTRKKIMWYAGLLFSAVALYFFIMGFL